MGKIETRNGRDDIKHRNWIKYYGGHVHKPSCSYLTSGGTCWCTLRGKKIIKNYWFFKDEGKLWGAEQLYIRSRKWIRKKDRKKNILL